MIKVVNIRSTGHGDYRIPAPNGTEDSACYESTIRDAVDTAKEMWKGLDVIFKVNGHDQTSCPSCGKKGIRWSKLGTTTTRKCKRCGHVIEGPKCIITNGQFSWILEVDGHKIGFQGAYNAEYFVKHYKELGYVVELKEDYRV